MWMDLSVAALCYLHDEQPHVAQCGVPPAAAAAALPRARANLQTDRQNPTHLNVSLIQVKKRHSVICQDRLRT